MLLLEIVCICLLLLLLIRYIRQLMNLNYDYNYCIISLPNGEIIEGELTSWLDFEDGDQIQVLVDNTTYLVHSSNIVLISK